MTLKLGTVLMTQGISSRVKRDMKFNDFVSRCVVRHKCGDWGDLCEEDRRMNDEAIEAEREGGDTDRLFSAYETGIGKLYVITEWDRSTTTVLTPGEYRA